MAPPNFYSCACWPLLGPLPRRINASRIIAQTGVSTKGRGLFTREDTEYNAVSISVSSVVNPPLSPLRARRLVAHVPVFELQHLVHDAVLFGGLGAHVVVALRVFADALQRLAG